MSRSMQKRCIICGRPFEIKALEEYSLLDDSFAGPPVKSTSICPVCEARIKKEAGDTQKDPKPM